MPSVQELASPATDHDLVRGLLAGDEAAFVQLMRRYNRRLYRTARAILGDDAEAQDVLQDAYILALRGIGAFRGDAQLSTWLTRIVANEAMGRRRKAARRAEIIPLDADAAAAMQEEEAMETDGPEQAAMRAQARALLERKIDQLPEAFRAVFVLRAVEELGVDEVAVVLGIPEATVRTRFFRARSLLRESVSREFDHVMEDAFGFDGERCDRIVEGTLARLHAVPTE
ncbi:MAG: RNA polymerase sigma factor [Telluria sp.]